MRWIDLLHRWCGGLIGLGLVVLGLSGTLLVHKDAFLRATVPHAAASPETSAVPLSIQLQALFSASEQPIGVTLASRDFALHRLSYANPDAGAYIDETGRMITHWSDKFARPEIWLFDLHHYLLLGKSGAMIAGGVALGGIGFVVTGAALWWRTRRSFQLPFWPKKWTRFGILRHHRDLGALAAPLLLTSFITGAMMTLKPVENWLLRPFSSPAAIKAALRSPAPSYGPLERSAVDWRAIEAQTRARFPASEIRVVTLPTKPGLPIAVRVRQPTEPTPNGRTFLWFNPADSRLVEVRDALSSPLGARVAAFEYPLHSGKLGGWFGRVAMTASGLALTVLGAFSVYVFWLDRLRPKRRRRS